MVCVCRVLFLYEISLYEISQGARALRPKGRERLAGQRGPLGMVQER